MTLTEFILNKYNVLPLIKRRSQGPEALIAERDDLPYDSISHYDGILQKCVEIDDETFIPVIYILGLTEKDFDGTNPELEEVWRAYMSQIDIEPYELNSLCDSAQAYLEEKDRKKALFNQCMN